MFVVTRNTAVQRFDRVRKRLVLILDKTKFIKYKLYFIVTFKMQDPKIRPNRMVDIEGNCVKAVETYMQVKAESNDFIRSVHKI